MPSAVRRAVLAGPVRVTDLRRGAGAALGRPVTAVRPGAALLAELGTGLWSAAANAGAGFLVARASEVAAGVRAGPVAAIRAAAAP